MNPSVRKTYRARPPQPMSRIVRSGSAPRRVAIVMNLGYALKRHLEVFAGAYGYACKRGWQVDAMPFADPIYSARRGHVKYDGIVARVGRRLAAHARTTGVPLVNVWYSSPARNVPLVFVDQARVAALAADHLLARGFRRFAFAGFGRVKATGSLDRAFRAALGDAAHSYDRFETTINVTVAPRTFAAFERALIDWLGSLPRPVAILACDDELARHIINVARVHGIDVPGDVAVMGLNNDEPFCLLSQPTLSSIDYGHDRIGIRAARLLEELMDGRPPPAEPVLLAPRGLVPRDSTDVFASDDPLVAAALRYMADSCDKPINVNDVVRKLQVCGQTLARRFRTARGCRPIEELTRMRIARAKRLLADGDLTIAEVARQCGFNSRAQFFVAFRRAEKVTPGTYRSER